MMQSPKKLRKGYVSCEDHHLLLMHSTLSETQHSYQRLVNSFVPLSPFPPKSKTGCFHRSNWGESWCYRTKFLPVHVKWYRGEQTQRTNSLEASTSKMGKDNRKITCELVMSDMPFKLIWSLSFRVGGFNHFEIQCNSKSPGAWTQQSLSILISICIIS